MEDPSQYENLKEKTLSYYNQIEKLRCPALHNDIIHFTNEGFRHLMYKGAKRKAERNKSVQIMKFKLLPKATDIIKITTTYQEYDEQLIDVVKKKKKRTVKETSVTKYWGFVAIINNFRLKAIVRQVGNGQKHFWSVIPAWSKSHYREIKTINNSKGNLADD